MSDERNDVIEQLQFVKTPKELIPILELTKFYK